MSLPAGAGPTGARFGGTVWTPPTLDPDNTPDRPLVLVLAAALDTSGRMVATWPANASVVRLVSRMVVQASAAGRALVYLGSIQPANLLTGTLTGDFDENDALSPYVIPEGTPLLVHWESTPTTAQVRLEYREV